MTTPETEMGSDGFSAEALERIVVQTFVEGVRYHTELDSTNTTALELAREEGSLDKMVLVIAERQHSGRGRGENRWWSGSGGLTFSLLLPAKRLALPAGDWPKSSLVAGLAVGEALEQMVGGEAVRLKWPNDVYLCDRKVCGILVEAASGARGAMVIGIGVNVNNSLREAPDAVASRAIAVREVVGREISRAELLIAILQRLEARLRALGSGDCQWLDDWRQKCLLTGRTVHLDTPAGLCVGVCQGIDEDGALLLESSEGQKRYLSGVVSRFD